MYDLKEIFKKLGLPIGLVGVIVAVLAWMGLDLDQLVLVAASLLGLQLLISVVIDILKYFGVVDDGLAGKWSAVLNLVTLIGVAVWLRFFPSFDLVGLDVQLGQLANVIVVVFAYVVQLLGTKRVHQVTVQNLGIQAASLSRG